MPLLPKFLHKLKRFPLGRSLLRLLRRVSESYVEFHAHAEFKIRLASLIGAVGFPFFYFAWTWLFPQPYESTLMRALGTVISLVLGLSRYWPNRLKPHLPLYSYLAFLYALPFFFTYMLLMNGANTVWQVSTMAAFVYVALLYDSANTIIVSVLGSLLGCAAFAIVTGGAPIPNDYFVLLFVLAFALAGLLLLNYSDNRIVREKMHAASTLASHIAHEMRTPLLGIKFDAERVEKHIPSLAEGFTWAAANGWKGPRPSNRQIEGLLASMERIREHTRSANLVIDMLLVNAGQENISSDIFETHSARNVLEAALDRYHFRPDERQSVHLVEGADFQFFGSDLLLVHTIFNLLKNALRALESVGGGRIEIRLARGTTHNRITVADDGPGIAPENLNQIFIPFVTGEKQNEGTGIGLAFSRFVVESFDGELSCRSELGQGAEFTIALPNLGGGGSFPETKDAPNST